jgi:hypothetical protein
MQSCIIGVETMAKKNSILSTIVNDDATSILFKVAGAGEITLDVAALSAEVRNRAMLHGLIQKVSDAAAIPKSDLTGDAATDAATKFNAMQAVANRLLDGDWAKRSGDGSGPVAGIIYRAFRQYVVEMAAEKNADAPAEEQTRAVYDARDRAGQLALRTIPRIAEIIETLKASTPASNKIDTSALLGELGL